MKRFIFVLRNPHTGKWKRDKDMTEAEAAVANYALKSGRKRYRWSCEVRGQWRYEVFEPAQDDIGFHFTPFKCYNRIEAVLSLHFLTEGVHFGTQQPRPEFSWVVIPSTQLSRQADFAVQRSDGAILLKRYDKTYRRVVAGKWLLYDNQGVCLGYLSFFDQQVNKPPYQWAEQKLQDRQMLADLGF